jgi:hypothetical protein
MNKQERNKVIKFTVDKEDFELKQSLPLSGFSGVYNEVVELSSKTLIKSFDKTLSGIFELLEKTKTESDEHFVSQVKLNLAVDSSGEVSIVSILKGSVKGSLGLEFTIERKSQK